MRRLRLRAQARADNARAHLRRIRNRTRCLEEMPGHPEQLLDDGLAEVCERTGWIR